MPGPEPRRKNQKKTGTALFFDFEYYLANLQEWKQVYELEVFSYCLMTNHVHLVVQANDNLTAIPQLMKRLAGRQTRFVNALEKRSGSLWEGRYKISPTPFGHWQGVTR